MIIKCFKIITFVIASIFWNVTAPGTIFVATSRAPLPGPESKNFLVNEFNNEK